MSPLSPPPLAPLAASVFGTREYPSPSLDWGHRVWRMGVGVAGVGPLPRCAPIAGSAPGGESPCEPVPSCFASWGVVCPSRVAFGVSHRRYSDRRATWASILCCIRRKAREGGPCAAERRGVDTPRASPVAQKCDSFRAEVEKKIERGGGRHGEEEEQAGPSVPRAGGTGWWDRRESSSAWVWSGSVVW